MSEKSNVIHVNANKCLHVYLHIVAEFARFVWVIIRDGGKWWSKDHHLVVIKMPKNVDYFLKNGDRNFQYFLLNDYF